MAETDTDTGKGGDHEEDSACARYMAGKWPAKDPMVFGDNGGQSIYTSDNPTGGPATVPHAQDGHKHDYANKACLSCSQKPAG